jgi:RNA methyltransferase, TrmH family
MLVSRSQVKYIQSLGHKKFRDEEGVFIAEGPKIVGELLCIPGMRCRQIYALKKWISGRNGPGDASFPNAVARVPVVAPVPIQEVSEADLERCSVLSTPNQVLALFEKPTHQAPEFNKGITVVLDGIQDPGNLGTIVRTSDWFGITTVLCSVDSADVFNAKAIQSTMGSIGRVQVLYSDPVAMIRRYSELPVYAAVLGGKSLYDTAPSGRGWIVIGNESKGIGPELLELATDRITIPGAGRAESLNAAVATGIILSHLAAR